MERFAAMTLKTGVKCEIRLTAKAITPSGMSLDEFEQHLKSVGNTIVRRESDGIVIAQQQETAYEMRTA